MQFISQDFFSLSTSSSKGVATATYELPRIRYHKGVAILISNTVSGASGTLDAKLQWQNPYSLVWTDMPIGTFVQWGAGVTGEKFIQLYGGATGSDADASLTLVTDFKLLGLAPLRTMRLSVTVGTGAVTYSACGYLLP